jgi:ribosomal protein S18 acetylase RimI-like enzyme
MGTERRGPGGAAGAPLISRATGDAADALRALFREYFAWLGPEGWFTDVEAELAALPGGYDAVLVARNGEEVIGCVALRALEDGVCEMKRLYVRPAGRGTGAGRALAAAIVETARVLGYRTMRLDTLPTMGAAQALYRSLGFVETERYNDNPVPGVLFFELAL